MERGTRKRDSQEVRRLLDSVKFWFSQPKEIDLRVKQSGNGLNVAERRMLHPLAPSSRILDIGCAAGRASIDLANRGHNVVGVDVVEPLISEARQAAEANRVEVTFQVCDPMNLCFPDGSFDAALSLDTYCYIPKRLNRLSWLKEVARILDSQGWLFLSQYVIDDILGSYEKVRDESYERFAPDYEILEEGDGFTLGAPSYVHFFMEADLLDELGSSPFQIIDSFRSDNICYCSLKNAK